MPSEGPIVSDSTRRAEVAELLGVPDVSQESTLEAMLSSFASGWRSIKLLGRRLRVYAVAWYVRRQYMQAEDQCKNPSVTRQEQAQIWYDTHDYCAGLVCSNIFALEGLWVKLGQYMSTRTDILPEPWGSHLSQLQDTLPPKSFDEVSATLAEELDEAQTNGSTCGCKRRSGASAIGPFERVEATPLGTASIAQVHRAWLVGGHCVVVKVQHRGVDDIIRQDLENAKYLVDELAKSQPEYDFRDIINEWCAETEKEVDFVHEAENTDRVAANLKSISGVKLPRVLRRTADGISLGPTRKVLVLEYIDGVKPTDTHSLKSWGISGEEVMQTLSAAFAHQIFVDGLFNGDPHPGNILIERNTGIPVLLDFGFVKELQADTRIAFCRLILAAAANDFAGLLQALKEMGLSKHVSLSNPEKAMQAVQYMFRDATPDNTQRRPHSQVDEPDSDIDDHADDLLPTPIGGSLPPVPPIARPSKQCPGSSPLLLHGPISCGRGASENRSTVEATPGTVIFLLRVVSCLRGIAVSLGCQHSYLTNFAPYARQALRAALLTAPLPTPITLSSNLLEVKLRQIATELVQTGDALGLPTPMTLSSNLLEVRLRQIATELVQTGDALGLQVCVFRHGVMQASFAWGEMGSLDPRPMQLDSLICGFSCGKMLGALLLHILVDRGLIASLDDPVCKYWPAFAESGKERITIRQILEHTSGLAHAMPSAAQKNGVGAAVRRLCNFDKMRNWIATAKPKLSEIGIPEYHAVTQGWLVAGLAEKVAQAHDPRWTYPLLVQELVLRPLGIMNEVAVRIPEEVDQLICNGHNLESRVASIGVGMKSLPKDSSVERLGSNGMQSLQEMGMDPRVFNDVSLRSALLPAVNTHWTARGLATIYAALASDGAVLGQGRVLSAAYCRRLQEEMSHTGFDHNDLWPNGFRKMRIVLEDGSQVYRGFGFPGLYNNMGYCDPAEGLGAAVLVNQLDMHGTATRKVLEAIASVLHVSSHSMDGLGMN